MAAPIINVGIDWENRNVVLNDLGNNAITMSFQAAEEVMRIIKRLTEGEYDTYQDVSWTDIMLRDY